MTGRGVENIAYGKPSPYPPVQETEQKRWTGLSISAIQTAVTPSASLCLSFLFYMDSQEAPMTHDPVRDTSSSEVIGISPEKEVTFGTPGAVLGKAAPGLGGQRKLPLDYQWQCVTHSCPNFTFYINIYKLFKAQLKPDAFCKLSNIAQNITPFGGGGNSGWHLIEK